MSAQCQGALIGQGVNFLSRWDPEDDFYHRCDGQSSHRVLSGCVHEHVLAWDACTSCAAKARWQITEGRDHKCVKCSEFDGHICPVLVQVEELPLAGAA